MTKESVLKAILGDSVMLVAHNLCVAKDEPDIQFRISVSIDGIEISHRKRSFQYHSIWAVAMYTYG